MGSILLNWLTIFIQFNKRSGDTGAFIKACTTKYQHETLMQSLQSKSSCHQRLSQQQVLLSQQVQHLHQTTAATQALGA
jgi:hypothetical protein